MNLQNHIKIVFINIKPIYFCIPDMLIIWQLFSFLDEQTNTIPFHTKHLYIYTWCELKKDHMTYKYPIMIQQILDVKVEIWDMLILVQNFCIFFANKTIHDCIGEKHTPSLQQKQQYIHTIDDLYKKNTIYCTIYTYYFIVKHEYFLLILW